MKCALNVNILLQCAMAEFVYNQHRKSSLLCELFLALSLPRKIVLLFPSVFGIKF